MQLQLIQCSAVPIQWSKCPAVAIWLPSALEWPVPLGVWPAFRGVQLVAGERDMSAGTAGS